MTHTIIIFTIANLINVMVSTARSLLTIKGGKTLACIANAVCYGYYTYIVYITVVFEIPILYKVFLVAGVNVVGVWIVKFIEQKLTKDKMWVYNVTAKTNQSKIFELETTLKELELKLLYNELIPNELYTIQIFSNNQKESEMIKSILKNYKVRYYAYETKDVL